MPRWIVDSPSGKQELVETGVGGAYFDLSRIVWCWDGHGEPPVKVDLGYMERVERIEPVKDANGKQLYGIMITGEHKTTARKVPLRQLVIYLRNRKTGRVAKSKKPPTPLPLED